MTGHGTFAECLHRFQLKTNPSCMCDIEIAQTVVHLITATPVYAVSCEMRPRTKNQYKGNL